MSSQEKKSDIPIRKYNDDIVYNIGRIYVLLSRYLSGIYKEFGLNTAKFNLLMVAKHLGGIKGISQIELGDKLFVTAANITKLIDGLEKKGLVRRFPLENDRRVNLIKITEAGSQLLDDIWIKHVKAINAILKDFPENKRRKFNVFLEHFKNEMEEIRGEKEGNHE